MKPEKVPLDRFPPRLRQWRYKDRELWYLGDLNVLRRPLASVIGTRSPSPLGTRDAQSITGVLVELGFGIVSGLAEGIDTAAHRVALDRDGATIAVLGTPIDECYPKSNQALKDEIARRGLVVSQFAPGTRVHKSNFPQRNTLMAALSDFTIVIEASEKSGTRYQVKSALEFGRHVGFLPSVADQRHAWVLEALSRNLGHVLRSRPDLLELARATPAIPKNEEQLRLGL